MSDRSKMQAVCFLCSILDEATKSQRRIAYDSPAATKKVLDVCNALKGRFKHIYILTMGRGKQQGDPKGFPAVAKRISGLPVIYARFIPLPILTYIVSTISLLFLTWRLVRHQNGQTLHLIVYNRNSLYLPSLLLARLLDVKCYLDLEDGALVETAGIRDQLYYWLLKSAFDALCSHGSILVAPGLVSQVKSTNNVVCYGVAQSPMNFSQVDWSEGKIRFLLGGTLIQETGIRLMMDAVKILNRDFSSYKNSLVILVTGHGPLSDDVATLAQAEGNGWIDFRGRVTRAEYDELLGSSHVGLCLKLPSSEIGSTTFPSKVIEIAAQGKLVLTTALGHVKDLFGTQGAVYLESEDPYALAKAIIDVVSDRKAAMDAAAIGQQRVQHECGPETVADAICTMFSESLAR